MGYHIRKLEEDEQEILTEFLYEAIYIPAGTSAPPKNIIEKPELQLYISDWGQEDGYKKASLSVQKANYAFKMYLKLGFEVISENNEEFIMVKVLNPK